MKKSRIDFGLFIIRFLSGFLLFYLHGLKKLQNPQGFVGFIESSFSFLPFPELFAWMSIITESLVAVFFALGLFTRFSAILLTVNFLFILYYHIQIAGDPLKSFELVLLYFAIFLAFSIIGTTGYSLDRNILKKG